MQIYKVYSLIKTFFQTEHIFIKAFLVFFKLRLSIVFEY